jgi:hypothetical protein
MFSSVFFLGGSLGQSRMHIWRCFFGACARRCLSCWRLCSQMLEPLHGLHWLLGRLCSQMLELSLSEYLKSENVCACDCRYCYLLPARCQVEWHWATAWERGIDMESLILRRSSKVGKLASAFYLAYCYLASASFMLSSCSFSSSPPPSRK